jgi:hypothetical protein
MLLACAMAEPAAKKTCGSLPIASHASLVVCFLKTVTAFNRLLLLCCRVRALCGVLASFYETKIYSCGGAFLPKNTTTRQLREQPIHSKRNCHFSRSEAAFLPVTSAKVVFSSSEYYFLVAVPAVLDDLSATDRAHVGLLDWLLKLHPPVRGKRFVQHTLAFLPINKRASAVTTATEFRNGRQPWRPRASFGARADPA